MLTGERQGVELMKSLRVKRLECFANDADISVKKEWKKSTLNDLVRKIDKTTTA